MKKIFSTIILALVAIVTVNATNSNSQRTSPSSTGEGRGGAPLTKTTVQEGKLQGFIQNGIGTFLGIPYAQPPVGDLRWKAPVPAKAWKGTLKATKKPAAPYQPVDPNNPEKKNLSEDCLYVNVWTPATKADEKLPVMVWIHGGGFITGDAFMPFDKIVKKGVIVASLEYRLGALGFLATPELAAESPTHTAGNYGLMDQVLALKWIKNNIAAFGGDPDKITIFGESAGAISVSMQCGSKMTKGLFRGAISESGGNFCPTDSVRFNNDGNRDQIGAQKHGLEYMKRIGAKNLKELRAMDAAKLVNDPSTAGVGGFWPCVDNIYLGDQYKQYENGQFNDVNILVGTNSDEGTMFVRETTVPKYEAEMHKIYGKFADRVLQLYPAKTDKDTYYAQSDQFRETAFAWPSFAWERLQQEHGHSKVYVYYFDQMQDFCFGGPNYQPRGAGHATDLDYVTGYAHDGSPLQGGREELSDKIITYWTNFAKYGDPNGDGTNSNLLQWPIYNQDKTTVMHFKDNKCDIIAVPNREKLEFWQDYYQWKRDNWKDR